MALMVLYLHPIAAFGGASRSLMELVRGFPEKTVEPVFVVPRGQVADLLIEAGWAVEQSLGIAQYDCTRFGHYRGSRWLILLREFALFPSTIWTCCRASSRWRDIDLIHVNEITAILAAVFLKALLRKPLIVHVRSVQQIRGIHLRRRLLEHVLRQCAGAVIAIDETVRASLPPDIKVDVVNNSYTPSASTEIAPVVTALKNRFHKDSLRVGMVGNLLAMKGVYEFLEAASLCIASGANVDFILVGNTPRMVSGLKGLLLRYLGFAHDMEADIGKFVDKHALHEHVHHLGFLSDVGSVYQSIDLLCFPSYLDAVGRPVLEAAWFEVPSIVALDHPLPDTFIDGETGVSIPARNPKALADAICRLSDQRDEVRRMGKEARQLAETRFDSRKNARTVLSVYERVLDQHGA